MIWRAFPFSVVALAMAAIVGAIADVDLGFNVITHPSVGDEVKANATFRVEWISSPEYDELAMSIYLLMGTSATTLAEYSGPPIASRILSSRQSYDWDVDPSLGDSPLYGLMIKLDSNPDIVQYSFPFTIQKEDASTGSTFGSKTESSHVTPTGASEASTTVPLVIPPEFRGPDEPEILSPEEKRKIDVMITTMLSSFFLWGAVAALLLWWVHIRNQRRILCEGGGSFHDLSYDLRAYEDVLNDTSRGRRSGSAAGSAAGKSSTWNFPIRRSETKRSEAKQPETKRPDTRRSEITRTDTRRSDADAPGSPVRSPERILLPEIRPFVEEGDISKFLWEEPEGIKYRMVPIEHAKSPAGMTFAGSSSNPAG